MKAKDLAKAWDAPDNSKLTPKQISLRLPIMVSAKISAICDMYPRKTKTEIIGDLLAAALDQFAEGLESEKDRYLETEPIGDDPRDGMAQIFDDIGSRGRYWNLTRKYLRDLEKEAGIEDPMPVPGAYIFEPIKPEDY